MWFENTVEFVQNEAWLHGARQAVGVKTKYLVQILAVVDDQGGVDGLTALGGSSATRKNGVAFALGKFQSRMNILDGFWDQDTFRHDLINRSVRCILAA